MRAGPFLMLALLAMPSAAAQLPGVGVVAATLNVFVEDPGRAFIPGTNETVVVIVNYAPQQGGRPAPAPTAEEPENTTPTHIAFAPKTQPAWISSVTFEPPEVFINMKLENATKPTYSARVNAILAVAPDAPALQRESFVVTATADPNGNIQGASQDSPDLKLRATTVGKLNVSADPMLVIHGGRWTTIPYTVRNDGNSPIVAKINVTVRPELSQVEFTDTLELAAGETKIVEVRVRTPWTNAEFGELELEATPIVDGEPGTASRALVEVRGESAVPGAWGALAVLGALLAGRAKRGRR
ncbi:MAG TPA: hypothetical protein VM370_07250 [Candidatus Thermoplasmatota archaeon]|nr:hypothetical protein [Candidatus Thermoplasmatota archaeon]